MESGTINSDLHTSLHLVCKRKMQNTELELIGPWYSLIRVSMCFATRVHRDFKLKSPPYRGGGRSKHFVPYRKFY